MGSSDPQRTSASRTSASRDDDDSLPRLVPGGGFDTIRRVREQSANTRVLVLTMHDDHGYVQSALSKGAAGYLTKRAAAKELVNAIRTVSEGRSYLGVSLSEHGLADVVSGKGWSTTHPEPREVLSGRELQVLTALAYGHTNKEVARELGLSTKSIDTYRVRLQAKLGIKGRVGLVRCALDAGLLKLPGQSGDEPTG